MVFHFKILKQERDEVDVKVPWAWWVLLNASRIPKGPSGLSVGMFMEGAVESDPRSKQSPETSPLPETSSELKPRPERDTESPEMRRDTALEAWV